MDKILTALFICIVWTSSLTAQSGFGRDALKQNIGVPPIPSQATFCGEKVPLEYFDVKESLGRELNSLSYWHSSMIYTIQLSGRYMDIIEKLLKRYGVPDDMKYLCVAESNLQNVVSPARAAGFWQFLPGTAKEFGLQITAEIDERYNLEKATKAACEYLKMAYNKFGNWTLAAASYNVGMTHIANQVALQKQNSYYDLQLNQETIRYVYRAVAYKLVMTEPEKFGFDISSKSIYEPLVYKEIDMAGPVDWIAFSEKYGTNYKILKIFNPWIISTKLSTNKTYKVKIPLKRTL
ncbi:MAG: lytic transglycosylase domain-containing protein [Prevotellaceae bacterium]|nr:lytic transglycosylase domain-containing protein [Prevotellaceae bacterium]